MGPVNLIGGVERIGSYTISQVVEIIRYCPTVVPFTVDFTLPTSSQVTPNTSAYSSRIPESDTRKKMRCQINHSEHGDITRSWAPYDG